MSSLFAGPSSAKAPDAAAQDLFRRLKPICVPLMANSELTASTSRLLTSLADELETVPAQSKPLKPSLLSYVFFPVSTLLRRNSLTALTDSALEPLLRVLGALAESWWYSADAPTSTLR